MRNECTMGMQCRGGRELNDWYIYIQNFCVQLYMEMIKWKSHREITWFKNFVCRIIVSKETTSGALSNRKYWIMGTHTHKILLL